MFVVSLLVSFPVSFDISRKLSDFLLAIKASVCDMRLCSTLDITWAMRDGEEKLLSYFECNTILSTVVIILLKNLQIFFLYLLSGIFILNGHYPRRAQHVTTRQKPNQRALRYHRLSQYNLVVRLIWSPWNNLLIHCIFSSYFLLVPHEPQYPA